MLVVGVVHLYMFTMLWVNIMYTTVNIFSCKNHNALLLRIAAIFSNKRIGNYHSCHTDDYVKEVSNLWFLLLSHFLVLSPQHFTLHCTCVLDLILLSLLLLADWLLYSGSCYMGEGKSVTDHSVIYIL